MNTDEHRLELKRRVLIRVHLCSSVVHSFALEAVVTSSLNNAKCSGSSCKRSGCHCTPSMSGYVGSSVPSMMPSGDLAITRSPRPTLFTACLWLELTLTDVLPIVRAGIESAT